MNEQTNNPVLEKAQEIAEEHGRPWDEMGNYERREYLDAAQEAIDNYDGAPYCQYCGAKTRQGCDCVIAENH